MLMTKKKKKIENSILLLFIYTELIIRKMKIVKRSTFIIICISYVMISKDCHTNRTTNNVIFQVN